MTGPEFEKFFREEFNALSNLAYTVVKDTDEARDVVQQVFLNYWQNRENIVIRGAAKGYFYKAVLNTAVNRLNKSKRLTTLEGTQLLTLSQEPEAEDNTRLKDQLHTAINNLPPVCQHVFRLSRFSDMTNKEIAQELDISVKAVEKHNTKALKVLREQLKPLYKSNYLITFALAAFCSFYFYRVGYLITNLSI
jgi:RNA polymerase sigma-70 factor (ECF subfamily)